MKKKEIEKTYTEMTYDERTIKAYGFRLGRMENGRPLPSSPPPLLLDDDDQVIGMTVGDRTYDLIPVLLPGESYNEIDDETAWERGRALGVASSEECSYMVFAFFSEMSGPNWEKINTLLFPYGEKPEDGLRMIVSIFHETWGGLYKNFYILPRSFFVRRRNA